MGYDEALRRSLHEKAPKEITSELLENQQLKQVSCGKSQSFLLLKNGNLLAWGKGEHENPRAEDYCNVSVPFLIMRDKQIV